jgi:hypothetical protein
MKPISRGKGPTEYTLRIACELSFQFNFDTHSVSLPFVVDGITCHAQTTDNQLVISATEFANPQDATIFFYRRQLRIADASVHDRVAISIPSEVREASSANFQLPEGESSMKHTQWPKTSIQPILIYSTGAWIYPEHEYVLLYPVFSINPTFQVHLQSFLSTLEDAVAMPMATRADPQVLLAASFYTQAIRSTQWVWSFLLAVMTLEMLSARGPRKKSVISLVQKYCAPTIAVNSRQDLFTDPKDCEVKVAAVYKLRSQYTHEGHVPSDTLGLPTFEEARNVALQTLAHIIHERLAGR